MTISVKLEQKRAVTGVFWSKNFKPVVVSLKPGVFQTTGFNEYHHRLLSFYLQKHVNTANFHPSFAEYRQQKMKKYRRVSTETVI